MGERAVIASRDAAKLTINDKNKALELIARALTENADTILKANEIDMENGKKAGMKDSLLDRLKLTKERIEAMAEGALKVRALDDPTGEVIRMWENPNGLRIGQKRVPIGVIGIIYESRPNVTVDAFVLCFKAGNAAILKGGSDAINSNIAITSVIRKTLEECDINSDCIQLIEKTDRTVVDELLKLNQYIDVVIPRGGAGLINFVVNNSTIPVIETGTGNCHIFVDASADFDMALNIIENAKTQRTGVCNACESLLVHRDIADEFIPLLANRLFGHNVEIRGDEKSRLIVPEIKAATDEDYGTEYLDLIVSLKIVENVDEAIYHINKYNTGHSEAIVTNDYNNSEKFLNEVDAAAVYVNASTRFTDGFEFGFGAEIGISTQKIHARGPMGLKELTTTKYIIYGNGQIR
ncbi:MAG: glutamate-5-semialdehyde dehydrogenase [Butyrivibrio sp.]|nr:glutamate-5-semialdehyde dehydrogenase [Butyrivibrio sp.]